jgi:diacylglycerol kinase (ATP)
MERDMNNEDIGDGPLAVLVNPTAGRGRYRAQLPAVLERLRSGGRDLELLSAGSTDEALAACRQAVAAGAAALVSVGGDGTVHAGLQAVAGTPVPFGAVPAGTGNDFAVEVGVPQAPLEAADTVARALREGRTRRVDLARLTQSDGGTRWYGAVLGAGFDAIVNDRANRMRFPQGHRRYDVAIAAELLRLRPYRYTLRLDGVEKEFDANLVAVGNTASYGGGMRICPAADPTDGLLDVLVGGPLSRATLIRLSTRVRQGTHVDHPLVSCYRAEKVELFAEGITAYVDGEPAGPLPVTVISAPGALRLLSDR